MARILNRFELIGNLTRSPEIKMTAGGTKVATIDIAQNKSKKKPDGTYEDVPLYHRVTAYGSTAEFVEKYVDKGAKVFVEGEIVPYSFEAEGGEKKYGIRFDVRELLSLDKRSDGGATARDANEVF